MKFTKGQKLLINHSRKGKFNAIAKEDFDTGTSQSFPVVIDGEGVSGLVNNWIDGETIPCARNLVISIETRN